MSIFDVINRNIAKFTSKATSGAFDKLKAQPTSLAIKAQPSPLIMTQEEISKRISASIQRAKSITTPLTTIKGIAQEIAKSTGSIGLALTGKKELRIDPSAPKWQQAIQRNIFGTEPVESFGTRVEKFPERAAEFGIPESISKAAAPWAVGLITTLDLTGLGGEKNVVRILARSKSVSFITKTLKQIGVADDIVIPAAQKISKITDEKEIKIAIDRISELQKTTKHVKPLAQEARKYKSAHQISGDTKPASNLVNIDDIVQKHKVTNGYLTKYDQTDLSKLKKMQGNPEMEITIYRTSPVKELNSGDWITTSKTYAQDIKRQNGGRVYEYTAKASELKYPNDITELPSLARFSAFKYEPITQATKGAGTKERGFIVGARKIVPKAETRIAGQYIPRATDSLAIKARNLVIDDIRLAEKIALTRSDDVAVATASELLKKYADDAAKAVDQSISSALYDKAADVANTLAPKLTEQGRSIQAASILGRLTPEGQVRFAAREIQKFNELNPLKAIPELSGQQSKFILDEMKIINAMPEGVEKAMRFQKLQKGIQDLVPTPLFKKVIAVWKAGLLTGIKTQGLNLFSNISHGITEVVKDIPAAIVDNVAALFTGKRAKTLTIREAFSGLKDGLIKGKRYFVTGFDERNIAAKLDYKRVNFGKGIVAKSFQVYTDTVFRFLGAADQPFYYAAMSRSLMDQALALGKTKGLKGKKLVNFAHKVVEAPTEEMIRYGVADATTAVFQNQTKLGEAAAAIQKIPGIGEIILPFGRTPSSVAMQIINYSPVGIAKTIISNIGKGRFDQRLFSQGIGRGLTGTAIIAIGMEMSKKGMIALDYPQGDERLQELQKAEGVKNNAIKINGKWRSPIVLGPAGNLLLIGGHFQKAIEEEGSPTEALTKGMAGSMSSFLEQTFLTGVKSSVNAITDPERYAKTYLPNLVASFVPTIVSDVARATTGEEKRTEGVLQRIQSRIPGLRRKLEPQVDILGRERERIGNPLEVLADPSRPSPERGTLVTNELVRLRDEGFKVSPTALGNRQGYEGLTQEENTFLWKYTGQILDDKLTTLFNNETYKNASDNEKADAVENYVNNGKLIARVGMVIKLTQDLEGEELAKKLLELKAGGLLIKSVYDKWIELR